MAYVCYTIIEEEKQADESLTLKQEKDGSWKPAIPESYYPEWWEKLFCFFGRHNWTYKLPQEKRCMGCGECLQSDARTGEECAKFRDCSCHVNSLIIEDKIPDYATCVVCGTKYGK